MTPLLIAHITAIALLLVLAIKFSEDRIIAEIRKAAKSPDSEKGKV